jgi:hypothetical protein
MPEHHSEHGETKNPGNPRAVLIKVIRRVAQFKARARILTSA